MSIHQFETIPATGVTGGSTDAFREALWIDLIEFWYDVADVRCSYLLRYYHKTCVILINVAHVQTVSRCNM